MLQRAASNAYSWWWAGHIRTKQSKWLEQSLQDMEEKVEYVLKLIQEDGDSFAKRAEMYYKKRPELINFVEESYRAFRALAERYDSLSTELQNANTTIATCFPEQVQFAMDDEDDYNSAKNPKFNLPQGPNPNLPKVPKVPNRVLKGMITDGSKKLQPKKPTKPTDTKRKVPKSGLTKGEALEEIDKLQKDILALQTTKEFVKSSYENGISKYWGLENEIMEKQERVSRLQDEFGEGTVIDDNDARTLMAEAALKSCQETLAQLQDKQQRSAEEAKAENKKIEDARQRLKSLKHEFLPDQTDDETIEENLDPGKVGEDFSSANQEGVGPVGHKLEVLREKNKEQFEMGSGGSITVTELAEKVDDLVNKVISLEDSVSSQTVLIDRLRTEADDLQSQIRSLEDEKETLLGGTQNLKNRVKEMEEKLYGVQNLSKNFITQNINLQTHFTEAHSSLDQLSVKIQNVKPDEESEVTGSLPEAEGSVIEGKPQEALTKQNKGQGGEGGDNVVDNTSGMDEKVDKVEQNISASPVKNQKGEGKEANGKSDTSQLPKQQEEAEKKGGKKKDSSHTTEKPLNVEPQTSEIETAKEFEDELNWQQMLLSGLEDKERILLTEYTTILRNYKEVKKKLSEEEKKNYTLFETTVQVRDLKSVVSKKDQEIQSLRHKLNLQQGESGDIPEANDSAENEIFSTPPTEEEEAEIKFLINQPQTSSPIEEKFRGKIDAILDENLEFWLRFSTVFHQVQKFKTEVQDLQDEILQLKKKEVKKQEGKSSTSLSSDLKADVRAVYKHLTEKKTELTVWLEQSESLKDELQRRFSSICMIQEDITSALKEGVEEEEITFSSHQAAKFHGEVLNMKQENNMVNEELLAGIDHITTLRIESEKTLAKLDADYGLSESKPELRNGSRSRIPLRSFIFGIKAKKQKQSILSYMQHSKKASS